MNIYVEYTYEFCIYIYVRVYTHIYIHSYYIYIWSINTIYQHTCTRISLGAASAPTASTAANFSKVNSIVVLYRLCPSSDITFENIYLQSASPEAALSQVCACTCVYTDAYQCVCVHCHVTLTQKSCSPPPPLPERLLSEWVWVCVCACVCVSVSHPHIVCEQQTVGKPLLERCRTSPSLRLHELRYFQMQYQLYQYHQLYYHHRQRLLRLLLQVPHQFYMLRYYRSHTGKAPETKKRPTTWVRSFLKRWVWSFRVAYTKFGRYKYRYCCIYVVCRVIVEHK